MPLFSPFVKSITGWTLKTSRLATEYVPELVLTRTTKWIGDRARSSHIAVMLCGSPDTTGPRYLVVVGSATMLHFTF